MRSRGVEEALRVHKMSARPSASCNGKGVAVVLEIINTLIVLLIGMTSTCCLHKSGAHLLVDRAVSAVLLSRLLLFGLGSGHAEAAAEAPLLLRDATHHGALEALAGILGGLGRALLGEGHGVLGWRSGEGWRWGRGEGCCLALAITRHSPTPYSLTHSPTWFAMRT